MTIDAQASASRADAKHAAQRRADVTAAPEPSAPGIAPGRRARPVLWWAALGAAAVAMQLYVYGRWVTSRDFAPTPTGPDPVPHDVMLKAWILQGTFAAGAVATIGWLVWRCARKRRLTFYAQMWIAWVAIIWLDPWANLIRPQMMFNSYYFNRGSWVEYIPWWISAKGHLLPQPFLIETANYMTMVVVTIAAAKLMSYIKRRWPGVGLVGLFAPTWLAMMVFVFTIEELVVIRGGWVWWTSNLNALTFWSGTANAMPLTELALWGFTITVLSYQIYAYDTRGQAPVERGIDRVPVKGAARTALSTFALIGCATAAMGVYSICSAMLGLYSGDTPAHIPSYFTNGICGEAGAPPCPTHGGPIYRRSDYP
jgi:Spirocyclase AveC-like